MTDVGASSAFERLDGKLTVFALANGMDLRKEPSMRQLEWFNDGLERGILLRADTDGTVEILVRAWPFGEPERAVEERHEAEVGPERLTRSLEPAIAHANRLAIG